MKFRHYRFDIYETSFDLIQCHNLIQLGYRPLRPDGTFYEVVNFLGSYTLDRVLLQNILKGETMSTPQPPNVTVQAHPDNFQNILAGIMTGLQAFVTVEPFILQIIEIEKGQPSTVTFHPTQP